MAAAEYYSGGQTPPSRPQLNTYATPPYPMSDAPPPYSVLAESRPHSQPPPARHTSDIYRPYPPSNPQYIPEKQSRPPPQSSQYGGSYNPPKQSFGGSYHQQQSGYLQPPGPSAYNNQGYTSNPNYSVQQPAKHAHFRDDRSRDRSRSRSRGDRDLDRERDRNRRHRNHRPDSHHRSDSYKQDAGKKKSSSANTFIGAGGGALIGDAIFPGLGTIGGAILGGLGGHKVSKDKEKESRGYGSSNRSRGRSYSNDADYYYADDHRRGRKY
ncbi:uncharacterized protein RCC_12227 [Ramularia collo-cygni]|uniref:Glycine zipper 2TM domain-containing protein n=1 Tax=Ramularia collo-cygni TaxID=112498 RepID=A0A2D3UUF4_9PEZI|nr:uncharacterized protein RCC_12227 [Ramularia collo-cygni]CZT15607.1 uncharacterized protein RCC_12227 [Ramularia collo-cygni]